MSTHLVRERDSGVTELLERASREPLILRREGGGEYALLPLDEDVIDLLLERDPEFIRQCREIQQRVDAGQYRTHAEVIKELGIE